MTQDRIRPSYALCASLGLLATLLSPRVYGVDVNEGSPVWTAVMQSGETIEYYKYYNNGTTDQETALQCTTGHRPPYTYLFPGFSPSTDHYLSSTSYTDGFARSVCQIVNQSNVYWYKNTSASSGTASANSYPKVHGAEEFSVSPNYTGVKGISLYGSFNGTGSSGGGTASEVAYFTTRNCSDAGTEYGFVRDLTGERFYFYWTTYANCGVLDSLQTDPAQTFCRITNNACVSSNTMNCQVSDPSNVQQESADDYSHGVAISGLQSNHNYYYSAYVVQVSGTYKWRIQIVEPSPFGLATCAFNGGTSGPCTFDTTVGSWFPISSVYSGMSGYLVLGTSTAGSPPSISTSPGFYADNIKVGK